MSEGREDFRALMQRVCDGEAGAAQELVDRYGRAILVAVRRRMSPKLRSEFDSADFVQAVWASFFAIRLDNYSFEESEMLVRFLARLANNKVVNAIRQRLSVQHPSQWQRGNRRDPLENIPGRQPSPSEIAVAKEEWERVVGGQPEQNQTVADSRRRGVTIREIADKLGISERTVRRVVH